MPRKSKVITFSMPPEMAQQVQQIVEEESPLLFGKREGLLGGKPANWRLSLQQVGEIGQNPRASWPPAASGR